MVMTFCMYLILCTCVGGGNTTTSSAYNRATTTSTTTTTTTTLRFPEESWVGLADNAHGTAQQYSC